MKIDLVPVGLKLSQQRRPIVRFHCLATDYDGTLALHGHVDQPTVAALERLRASGRSLVMVTGRELEELLGIFPEIGLFDWIVAENGALLYQPESKEIRPLADPPDQQFVDKLRERGVAKLSVGRVIVATWEPYQSVVLETIRDLGLGLQVIFNKGAVMVLPSGVTKATGLKAALAELGLSRHNTVAVGDAENDHAMLGLCECGVAVSNALPALKERADWTTQADHGAGVAQLIDALLTDDLAAVSANIARHDIMLGRHNGQNVCFRPYGQRLLVAGSSGSGKSSVAKSVLERLTDAGYQACIVDPEGDFCSLDQVVSVGAKQQAANIEDVLRLLQKPRQSVVANLEALAPDQRRAFYKELAAEITELRAKRGHPHWVILDEAEQLAPADEEQPPAAATLPESLWIAVEPSNVATTTLSAIDMVISVGKQPTETLRRTLIAAGKTVPDVELRPLHADESIVYRMDGTEPPFPMQIVPSRAERRHRQEEFVLGNLGPERSFVFRGPLNRLKLRAQNLSHFLLMAEGVDDETWLHHLRQGDYSRWFREGVSDPHLGDEAARIETQRDLSADESRERIRHIIEKHYVVAAGGSENGSG